MFQWLRHLDRILRGEATRLQSLRGGAIDVPARGLSTAIIVLGAIYGVCMGIYSITVRWGTPTARMGYFQTLASMIKVPALFFLTLLVTFPSLYVFNAIVGSRLSILSVWRLLVASMAVMLAIAASFGTIVVFFSLSTTSYPFMLLLNVAVFTAAGTMGLGFLLQTLHRLTLVQAIEEPDVPPPAPRRTTPSAEAGALEPVPHEPPGQRVRTVFRIWIVVFALVGAQMAWVLRPFVGNPDVPFALLRPRSSNFFEAVLHTLRTLLSS